MSNRTTGSLWIKLAAVGALLGAGPAVAETVYVTDMLQLELYAARDMSGPPLKKLRSGDQMELLARDGRYAQVRTADGQQGWVKSL